MDREKGVVQTFVQHANRYELSFQTNKHTQNHKHSVDEKLRIIASTLFMDYLFFEGLPECVCVVFNCEGCSPVSNNNDNDIYRLLSCYYNFHHVLSLFITIIAITSVLCTWGLFVVQHFECPPQCWFKICDMYCCGALFPIYCKCCLKDAVRAAEAVATGGLSDEASKLL